LWFGLSLPVSGLIAHYYWRSVQRLASAARTSLILLRAPAAARRLIAMRQNLIAEIEAAHKALRSLGEKTT